MPKKPKQTPSGTGLDLTLDLTSDPWQLAREPDKAALRKIGVIPDGTNAGRPSVAMLVETDDGEAFVAETTLRLFVTAVRAFCARHGDPTMDNAAQVEQNGDPLKPGEVFQLDDDVVSVLKIKRSSNVRRLGWGVDPGKVGGQIDEHTVGTLFVQYKGGRWYAYEKCPMAVAEAALEADSVGQYLAAHVKGAYKYREINQAKQVV